jgi:lysophospholipase L1-like esterase
MRRGLLAITVAIGLLLATASAAVAAGNYVALGDSYASGNGTGVFYNDGTSCHRSPDAYPPLVSAKAGDSLTFAACSGATTSTVISSQLGSLGSGTSLVTITIGGNDAGFSNVMTNCALYYFTCTSAISSANSFIQNKLPGLLKTTYADIRADAPAAHVVVIGYPRLFTSTGTTCGQGFLTSTNEKSLNNTANLLDTTISTAVAGAGTGFTFVDPRTDFSSHELCSASSWLQGINLSATYQSFHPNLAGAADMALLVEGVRPYAAVPGE